MTETSKGSQIDVSQAPGIDLAQIRAAAARLEGRIVRTAFHVSQTLSAIAGCTIHVKFENHQFVASFKERGAANKLLTLGEEARRRGVIAVSAGNHAQGVAYHARLLGIPATIVMPENTPFTKVSHTRNHGATVILEGETLAEAGILAEKLAAEGGLTFVHPFDDPLVIAGQGTVALEMIEDGPPLDAVVIPIGGGGLIAGLATAYRALSPRTAIIGVQTARYPGMRACLSTPAGLVPGGVTIAEGIAVKTPGLLTRAIVRDLVDEVILVEEAEIERAVALFLDVEKTVSEGAGAAGLAAVLAVPERFRGRQVGIVLSGGNIDSRLLASVILRQLVRDGRVITLRIDTGDFPGALARITGLIATAGGNIIEVLHNRLSLSLLAKEAAIELTIETRGHDHAADIIRAVEAAGFAVRMANAGI